MSAIIVYPLPLDNWGEFRQWAVRFSSTFKLFPPKHDDYRLIISVQGGEITDDIRTMFHGIRAEFWDYPFLGCDIGSAQFIGMRMLEEDFVIGMTSRCYFHREGWLKRYMDARSKYGPGLYGASASYEGGKAHICTRAYGMIADLWRKYPHIIDTREKGQKFETGEWCVTTWVKSQNLPTIQVTWDGEQDEAHWRDKREDGIYRRGEQNAMLVWDRHTDLYRNADLVEKKRLANMADGIA